MGEITPAFIDGRDVVATDTLEVRSPYDRSVLGAVPLLGPEQLISAVEAARRCHLAGPLPAHERAAILDRAAEALALRQEEFALRLAGEAGKPVTTARVEAARALDTLRFSAGVARSLTGEMVPMDASSAGVGKLGFVKRVPIGVIVGISPFNFPLNLVLHKVAPAIAAGAPVVLKPASATPLTALALARLLSDAGLPPGWCNVVTCPGSAADALVEHPDVAMITFTGSPDVGWGIKGRNPRKKVSLELGNNAPVIIEPDADLDVAVAKIRLGGFVYQGQTCISVQRVYVHRSVHDEFVDALTSAVGSLVVGDQMDPSTEVSALINEGETDRVKSWIDEAVAGGARITTGGTLADPHVLAPTVLDGVTPDMRVCHTEVFGPLVGVAAYDTFDEAVALSNDSRYGLQASVFTSSLATALAAGDRLDYGGVLVNEIPNWRVDQMPYGGVRDSGNTREGPAYAVQEMTERRLVVIQP